MSRKKPENAISGRFLALPHTVMDSTAFVELSYPASRLLIDIARQYTGKNNGQLLCAASVMAKRGWNSNDTLTRARRELESAGFIQQTRMPLMPRRAAWYGLTWRLLDYLPEMDLKPADFRKNAFLLTRKNQSD